MTRVLLIGSTLLFSVLFMFYTPNEQWGFLFSDMVLSAHTWMYFLFEHVIIVLLALAIVVHATEFKITLWTFVGVEVLDTVDYVLFYGEPWASGIPTWNVIKIVIFCLVVVYEKSR